MEGETKSTETHGATGIKVAAAMVLAQFFQVGLNTIVKFAITKGMSNFVFVVYSNAMAFFFLLPSTFFFHRFFNFILNFSSFSIFTKVSSDFYRKTSLADIISPLIVFIVIKNILFSRCFI